MEITMQRAVVSDGEGLVQSFSSTLAEVISQRGATLKGLQRSLQALGTPVSIATLSYWRSGRSQPERESSLQALANLEGLLQLSPGELSDLIAPPRRMLRVAPGVPINEQMPTKIGEHVTRGLRQLDLPLVTDLPGTSTHVTLEIDDRGQMSRIRHRSVMRAIAEVVDRVPMVYTFDELQPEGLPRFTALGGCRIGRVYRDDEHHVYVAELVLEERRVAGDSAIIEVEVEVFGSRQDDFFQHSVSRPAEELVVWVRFHPDAIPADSEGYAVTSEGEHFLDAPLMGASSHIMVRRFGPGAAGIRWYW